MTTTATTQTTLQGSSKGSVNSSPIPWLNCSPSLLNGTCQETARSLAGARSTREEIAAYFESLWSVLDTSQADTTASHVLFRRRRRGSAWCFTQGTIPRERSSIRDSCRASHHRFCDDGLITRFRLSTRLACGLTRICRWGLRPHTPLGQYAGIRRWPSRTSHTCCSLRSGATARRRPRPSGSPPMTNTASPSGRAVAPEA